MTLLPSALSAPEPRVRSTPEYKTSAGEDVALLAELVGLELDPWQLLALNDGLGERPNGKWAAFEVALILARQNGKSLLLILRELAGLFLFGERLITHTAHEYRTARESFLQAVDLIESNDDLKDRVRTVRTAQGEEAVELKTGQRLRFMSRTSGSGRGFTGDCVILDEAYKLSGEQLAALLPTVSTRPNPQIWYASMAGMDSSESLLAIRDRGYAGGEKLCYLEWSAPPDADPDDRKAWAMANPSMGIRISEEFVEGEREALPEEHFIRERLGIWPSANRGQVIDPDVWAKLSDRESKTSGRVTFAIDVSPDRDASIAVAGRRKDGLRHVELIDNRKGTGWVPDAMAKLVGKYRPKAVLLDPAGPAGSLLNDLREAGVEVTEVSGRQMAQACGEFYEAVLEGQLRHRSQAKLNVAVDAARQRKLGDAWAWHRRDAASDISPLVACTLALHGYGIKGKRRERTGETVAV